MSSRLIIDGNSVYEIDEDCEQRKAGGQMRRQNMQQSKKQREYGKPEPEEE